MRGQVVSGEISPLIARSRIPHSNSDLRRYPAFRIPLPQSEAGRISPLLSEQPYLLAVLSRKGRLVAVVDVTVMSPLAPMVYTLPATNDTAVRLMAFVDNPA